jgi:hypothetical protein
MKYANIGPIGVLTVDHLRALIARLGTRELVGLSLTCHALRDGEFSRSKDGMQVLLDAVEKRLDVCKSKLVEKIGLGVGDSPVQQLCAVADIDWSDKQLDVGDARLLAYLCWQEQSVGLRARLRLERGRAGKGKGYTHLSRLMGDITHLDLREHSLFQAGVVSVTFAASCIRLNSSLRSCDVRGCSIGAECAKALVDGGAFRGTLRQARF